MIAMHTTLTGRLPPAGGMMALLGLAVTIGAFSSIYFADWFIYPMQWVSDFLHNAELMLISLLHLAGLSDNLSATYYSFARKDNVGVFAGGLYIATEVFYLVAVVVLATRAATQSHETATQPSAPKKTISAYLLLNLAYTVAFFYWIMFDIQFAHSYQDALLGPLSDRTDSLASAFIGTWGWKLMLFVPLQLALIVAVWRGSSWFKRVFAGYLLFDVVYYAVLSYLATGSHSGLFVSTLALLMFIPYLRK
jgi:hypothetical protein